MTYPRAVENSLNLVRSKRYFLCVAGAMDSRSSSRKTFTARSIVARDGAGPGSGTGNDGIWPSQDRAFSHSAATALASSHVILPVDLRLKAPARFPEAKMKQPHRFQPFLRSSTSPERESTCRFASHFPWWRRYKFRGMAPAILRRIALYCP